MPRETHSIPTRDESAEVLEFEHHVDREGLIAQVRALATAIQHLAQAIESHTEDDVSDTDVHHHLQEARLALRPIW
jgi:hypothetical protein